METFTWILLGFTIGYVVRMFMAWQEWKELTDLWRRTQ
jgi:hypothetical protein